MTKYCQCSENVSFSEVAPVLASSYLHMTGTNGFIAFADEAAFYTFKLEFVYIVNLSTGPDPILGYCVVYIRNNMYNNKF